MIGVYHLPTPLEPPVYYKDGLRKDIASCYTSIS